MGSEPTLERSKNIEQGAGDGEPIPGLVLLFSGGEPRMVPIRVPPGTQVLGRDGLGGTLFEDGRISRRHAELALDRGAWRVTDLKSRNGTFLDGVPVTATVRSHEARVLRIGDTLFALVRDLRPFGELALEQRDGIVLGPTLRAAWDEIARAASFGTVLHLNGESGSGKELAARHFHDASARAKGPFLAVNCAAIPPSIAERLLFGARKGAYSGAEANAEGYLQAAHGGTLFLDEIAELELPVQAKLLRALDAKEVLPLGASRPVAVDLALCTATHQNLRPRVQAGQFRADLFYRIATPTVRVPPLRERLEDIPWLVQKELQRHGLAAHVTLVETCLLRPWPGNVRELVAEIGNAAAHARGAGRQRVEAADLKATAGQELPAEALGSTDDQRLLEVLREEGGNLAATARRLGMHRTQVRRWVAKHRDQLVGVLPQGEPDDRGE